MNTMEFPLIEHELGKLGRRGSNYILRAVPIVLVVVSVLFFLWLATDFRNSDGAALAGMAETFERFAFRSVFALQQGIIVLFAPVLAAGAIAREKQDRTMVLLTLADFRGFDLYISKAASVFLQVGAWVLSMFPILIIWLSLGGLEVHEVVVGELKVFLLMVFVIALGLLCSTIAARPTDAVIMTFGLLIFYLLATLIVFLSFRFLSPVWMPAGWLNTVLYVLVPLAVAGCATWWSVRLLKTSPDADAVSRAPTRKPRSASRNDIGILAIYRGAVQSLGSTWLNPSRRWVVAIVCTIVFLLLQMPLGWIYHWIVLLILAYEIVSTVEASERQDTFDTLACTPATDRDFARAMIRVHFVRSLVFLPALALSSLLGLVIQSLTFFDPSFEEGNTGIVALGVASRFASEVMFLLFVVLASCLAVTRRGTTVWRVASVALGYFAIAFVGFFATTLIGVIEMFVGTSPTVELFQPQEFEYWVARPLTVLILYSLATYVFYRRLAKRIGHRWRNSGAVNLFVASKALN